MAVNDIIFGRPEDGYSYDSGTVRARAKSAEQNLPRLNAEVDRLEVELRETRARIAMWERFERQAALLETVREHANGGKDFTDEEGRKILFES